MPEPEAVQTGQRSWATQRVVDYIFNDSDLHETVMQMVSDGYSAEAIGHHILDVALMELDLDTGADGLLIDFAETVFREVDWDVIYEEVEEDVPEWQAQQMEEEDEDPWEGLYQETEQDAEDDIPENEEDDDPDFEEKVQRYFHAPDEVNLVGNDGQPATPGWYVAQCRENDFGGYYMHYLGPYETKSQAQDVWIELE